jgi:DNA-binding NarL/FixJ family response regulator
MGKRIRVLVAEGHDYLREQWANLLDEFDDLQVVGTAANGLMGVASCAQLQPNVILMAARMPILNGHAAIRAIRFYFPEMKVVILSTGFPEDEKICGASAFIRLPASIDEMANVIRAVHEQRPAFMAVIGR